MITNNLNLPQPFVDAATSDYKPTKGRYDVTMDKERVLDEATSFMEGFYRGVSDGLDDARRILDNVDEQISETLTIATKDL